jgi:hypothetical protein
VAAVEQALAELSKAAALVQADIELGQHFL